MNPEFLPVNKADLDKRGWDQLDIIIVTGDAYVDHPSFGAAVIGRILEHRGFRVGVIAMPDIHDPNSVTILGRPRLFFGVTSGNVDSMLANFTAFKMRRSDDPYAAGGKAGHRPNRALINYCNLIKQVYKDVPIVIGGIEASMRRIAHYDFWSNRVRRSMLEDTRADALVYGMGEKAIVEIADRLDCGKPLAGVDGTVIAQKKPPEDAIILPSEETIMASKNSFIEFYRQFYRYQHRVLVIPAGGRFLVHYPMAPMTTEELDEIFRLPFTRLPHPQYRETIPAYEMIKDSFISHRGCVSGCSFCALTLHQGKRIVSRSAEAVLSEIEQRVKQSDFKGHVKDIGGPSANNYQFNCRLDWRCNRESCTFPELCSNLELNSTDWLELLERASKIQGVKKVTIGSGIRFDLLMLEADAQRLLTSLIRDHISGQLKIAPEHSDPEVLRAMRKSLLFPLEQFIKIYNSINQHLNKKQHLIPYLMSCHPGEEKKQMAAMKLVMEQCFGMIPEQVQAFIPLPMTLSSVIYHTGEDPLTGDKYFVEKDAGRRRRQHQIFFKKS
ncbi:MAG: YgiQ family radical SAM protein [bacterium]|nr:YgiQ family radical SAM protein [bacterium]